MRRPLVALALAMMPAHTVLMGAQERATAETTFVARGLPRDVAREAAALFNSSSALRLNGRLEIEVGREVNGDVAVLNGPVLIGGHVTGRVIALNSDVILRPTARIDGDLLVVGGEVEGRDAAQIGGEIRIYRQALRYRQEGDQIIAERDTIGAEGDPWWHRWEHRHADRSWSKLQIASAGPYNRVEGLPINLGPQINRKYDWGSTRLDGYAIFRTGSSFSSEDNDVGHNVRADVRIGRLAGIALGGRLFNTVDAIESWQISDMEAALASFLAHRDYRDYFQRHGGNATASVFAWRDVSLAAGFGEERWLTRVERDPFTLFRNQAVWRPNPPVDEGRMHLATGTLSIDTRNDDDNPWSGWHIVADWERGVGTLQRVTVARLAGGSAVPTPLPPAHVDYTRGFVDLRRYNRLSPDAQLNMRIVLGGWLNGNPLPIERRLSVDGPGAMPGFGFRADRAGDDIGTCSVASSYPSRPALCDRIALAQVEYRGDLHFDLNPDWDLGDDAPMPDEPRAAHRAHTHHFRSDGTWVVFADAGRGWLVGDPSASLTYARDQFPSLNTFRTDIGAGLDFGGVGFYVAKALSVTREPARLFVRLRHRF